MLALWEGGRRPRIRLGLYSCANGNMLATILGTSKDCVGERTLTGALAFESDQRRSEAIMSLIAPRLGCAQDPRELYEPAFVCHTVC